MKKKRQDIDYLSLSEMLKKILNSAQNKGSIVYDAVSNEIEQFLRIEERYLNVVEFNRNRICILENKKEKK